MLLVEFMQKDKRASNREFGPGLPGVFRMYLISDRVSHLLNPGLCCCGDTHSAKARGARGARWAREARLSVKSIVARRTRRTL